MTIDPRDLLSDILEQAVKLTNASSGSLCLTDPEEEALVIEVAVGVDDDMRRRCRLPIGEGITGWVARHGQTLAVPDVDQDQRYVAVRPGVRSELAVPLQTEGRVLGVINVDSERLDAFPAPTIELLEMFARRCVDAIAYARLYEEVSRRREELSSLVEIGRELASTLDRSEVLRAVVSHARRLLGGRLSSLMLEREGSFETVAADGAGPAYISRDRPDVQSTLVGKVLRTGRPLVVKDVRSDPAFRAADVAESEGLSSLLSVPVQAKDRVLGVLNVYSGEPKSFRQSEIDLLTLLARHAAVAIENARLFQEVRDAGDRLRESEKLAALGRLSAGFAHELRNPLNTLNVLVYALTDPSRRDGVSPADLEVVTSEIGRMRLLLDQFLDFARPRPPRFIRLRVEEVLEETILLIGPEAAKRGIAIRRRRADAMPLVWADGDQLKQVFLNLALNALQAMSDRGTLGVGARPTSGGVVVELDDDGPGIAPEIRDRLFEPFFTTREEGTGLGLPIALRIIEGHSGQLRIDSVPGGGTAARVWLPA